MKILDCTLRDGGFHTGWVYERATVECYLRSATRLPIDIIEIGYRNTTKRTGGEYFHCASEVLAAARELTDKPLAVMVDAKDCNAQELDALLAPVAGMIDYVRIATDPEKSASTIEMADVVHRHGLRVSINLMYASRFSDAPEKAVEAARHVFGAADIIAVADSYGAMRPEQVKRVVGNLRAATDIPIGFHGHNNLELAHANALAAIEVGAEWIDATITGMGRGAGNVRTELLLSVMELDDEYELTKVVTHFEALRRRFLWGPQLSDIRSGAKALPQQR